MDKFDICYNISKQIIDNYIDLLYSSIYKDNYNMYNDLVLKIRDLVFQEYMIISSFTLDEINMYLEYDFNNDDSYDLNVIPRIINRLVAYKEIMYGKSISTLEFGLEVFSNKIDFSIYDSILSMINLDIIKSIKNKIYSLNYDCDGDRRFVNLLKKKLNYSKINFLFNSSMIEMLSLFYNTDIDKIPKIDELKIKDKISKFNDIEIRNSFTSTLLVAFDKNIKKLVSIDNINNNVDDVFNYLVLITTIEILISYMDKNLLKICYDYCSSIDNSNLGVNNVKTLIKNKIDN